MRNGVIDGAISISAVQVRVRFQSLTRGFFYSLARGIGTFVFCKI